MLSPARISTPQSGIHGPRERFVFEKLPIIGQRSHQCLPLRTLPCGWRGYCCCCCCPAYSQRRRYTVDAGCLSAHVCRGASAVIRVGIEAKGYFVYVRTYVLRSFFQVFWYCSKSTLTAFWRATRSSVVAGRAAMRSALYCGSVTHSRRYPAAYQFSYALFMVYLDLDELARERWRFPWWPLFSARRWLPAVAWFRSKHHLRELGPEKSALGAGSEAELLAVAVRRYVQRELRLESAPKGRVCLLTHLTYLGIAFNPVSFYYILDEDGKNVEYIVAEVNNIPWFEQHAYVLRAREYSSVAWPPFSRTNSLNDAAQMPADDENEDCIQPATDGDRYHKLAGNEKRHACSSVTTTAAAVEGASSQEVAAAASTGTSSASAWRWCPRPMSRVDSGASLNGGTPSSPCFVISVVHPKEFHVSPFIAMEGIEYRWLFSQPGCRQLRVFVELLQRQPTANGDASASPSGFQKFFGASLKLHRVELTAMNMVLCLLVYPLITLQAMVAIHYEAAKLYFRGFPFYPHPQGTQTLLARLIALIVAIAQPGIYLVNLLRALVRVLLRPVRLVMRRPRGRRARPHEVPASHM